MESSKYDIPLTIEAVADATAELGMPISRRAARDAIYGHRIGFVQIGRARFTSRDDLIAFFESCRVEPKALA
jgi:hypothetical protein